MTPAQKAVIAAAFHVAGDWDDVSRRYVLERAFDALDAERAAADDTRPWSLVVAEDEIFSTKTQKWYRVVKTARLPAELGDRISVRCEGMAKPFIVPADARVKVRRSEMGQAVDVWAGLEVISS